MADTDLVIGVEAVGFDQALTALNSLAAAETEVGAAADRMNSPLTKALHNRMALTTAAGRGAMASAAQATAFNSLTGATRGTAEVTAALGQTQRRSALDSLKALTANKKLGRTMATVMNEVSEFGFMIGGAIPSMRGLSINMAQAGNSAFGFARALGPLGVGAAALMGLLPGLISWLSGTGDQMDDTAASTDNASRSLRDYIATARQVAQERAQIERIMAGGGTEEELAGMIGMAETAAESSRQRFDLAAREAGIESRADRARLNTILDTARAMELRGEASAEFIRVQTMSLGDGERQTNSLNSSMLNLISTQRRVTAATAEHAEARRENLRLQAEDIDVEQMEIRDPTSFGEVQTTRRRGGGGGGGGGADAAATEEAARIAAEFEFAQQAAEMRQQLRDKEEGFREAAYQRALQRSANEQAAAEKGQRNRTRLAEIARDNAERANEINDRIAELGSNFGRTFEDGVDAVIESFDRLNEALAGAGRETIDQTALIRETVKASWKDIMSTSAAGASEAFGAAIDAAVSGEKSFADAMRAQTHEFIRGIVQRSTVAAVEQAAMALAAAASYNFPAAAAHGAAAAQYAAVAGVAASVGVAAGTFAPKKERAEAVKEPARQREREERQQTMVINVGTFPVSTDADVGRAVQQALRAAERRDGGR